MALQGVSHSASTGEVRIRAKDLAVERSGPSGAPMREATFTVKSGEVVGDSCGRGERTA